MIYIPGLFNWHRFYHIYAYIWCMYLNRSCGYKTANISEIWIFSFVMSFLKIFIKGTPKNIMTCTKKIDFIILKFIRISSVSNLHFSLELSCLYAIVWLASCSFINIKASTAFSTYSNVMITFKHGEQEEKIWANMLKCIWKAQKALGQCPWFIQVSAAWYDVCKTSCICGKSSLVLSANKQKEQQRHDRSPEIWSCLMHTTTSR